MLLPANNSTIHEMLKSAWKIVDSFLQSWGEVYGCLRCRPPENSLDGYDDVELRYVLEKSSLSSVV